MTDDYLADIRPFGSIDQIGVLLIMRRQPTVHGTSMSTQVTVSGPARTVEATLPAVIKSDAVEHNRVVFTGPVQSEDQRFWVKMAHSEWEWDTDYHSYIMIPGGGNEQLADNELGERLAGYLTTVTGIQFLTARPECIHPLEMLAVQMQQMVTYQLDNFAQDEESGDIEFTIKRSSGLPDDDLISYIVCSDCGEEWSESDVAWWDWAR